MLATGPEAAERWRLFCADLMRKHNTIVVRVDDPGLSWADRELAKQLGSRLYGGSP
jgi:hypothetical protein